MHPLLRLAFRSLIIFLVIFSAIQPFNWFCALTQKCSPFYFSNIIPRIEGNRKIDVIFEVDNRNPNIDLVPDMPVTETVTNRKNTVSFYTKNISDKFVVFRPKLRVEPESAKDYIDFQECLCFKDHELKKGEAAKLDVKFRIKGNFPFDKFAKTAGYDPSNPDEAFVKPSIKIKYEINENGR